MKKTALISWLLCSGLSTSLDAATPGFDCTATHQEVERLICRDDQLAALDNQLAKLYQQADQSFSGSVHPSLRTTQREWIKQRDECAQEQQPHNCVQLAYQRRITDLMIRNGTLTVPAAVNYRCDESNNNPMVAVFYSAQTPLPAVILSRGDQRRIAYQVRSGSGAKFESSGVSFWEHHGEATGHWDQIAFRCQVLK